MEGQKSGSRVEVTIGNGNRKIVTDNGSKRDIEEASQWEDYNEADEGDFKYCGLICMTIVGQLSTLFASSIPSAHLSAPRLSRHSITIPQTSKGGTTTGVKSTPR